MGSQEDEPEEKTFSEPEEAAEGPKSNSGSRSCSDSGPEESGEAIGESRGGEEEDETEQKYVSDREL